MNLPPYQTFPELKAGQYRLRQILLSDLADIPDILFYEGQPAKTAEDAAIILNKIDKDYLDGNGINWGIENDADQKIIGTLGFYRGFNDHTGEIGCILKEDFRGKGAMAQALKAVTMYGLHEMELKTVCAYTKKENITAKALLDRIHFIQKPSGESGYLRYEISL